MDKTDMSLTRYRMLGPPVVKGVGRAIALPIHPDRLIPFWVFAVVTNGKMPVQIGNDQSVVQTGEYFLMPPGIRHFGTERMPFDTIWFHFDMDAEIVTHQENQMAASGEIILPVFGPVPHEINYFTLGSLIKRNLDTGYLSLDDVSAQLIAIFGQAVMANRQKQDSISSDGYLARRILDLLLQDYKNPITCESLSEHLSYSYGHLERTFRRYYGVTIRQKLTQIRIDEASALILMGKSLKEVAYETGFSDYYYFIRVFTKVMGKSPGRVASGN